MNVTGSSINTGWSAILTNIPIYGYHFFVINECATRLAFTIANSAPTITTTNQMWVSNSGTVAIDSIIGECLGPVGSNLYVRSTSGVINTGTCEVFFSGS